MARPMKKRNICALPKLNRFGPLGLAKGQRDYLVMTLDEYESIRLIDHEAMTQAECAQQMNIARTTVQGIYVAARKKIADSLVNGKTLVIKGGKYQLCDGQGPACGRGACRHQRQGRHLNRKMQAGRHLGKEIQADQSIDLEDKRREEIMKIAVPVSEKSLAAKVSMSFGRTAYYLIYDLTNQTAFYQENTAASASGGAGIQAAQILVDSEVDVLLTPRCGLNAAQVLQAAGIKLYQTEFSSAKENIEAYQADKLSLLKDIGPGHHGGA